MKFNLPILLTWARIVAIPFIVILYILPFHQAHLTAAIVFAIVALTDWLDGYLARSMNVVSRFGAFLDPVADKLLVAVVLVMLLAVYHNWVFVLCCMVIIGREIAVSAMREWLAEVGKRAKIAVSMLSKIKTVVQMLGIAFLLWAHPDLNSSIFWVGMVLVVIAAVLTVWTMWLYLKTAWPDLTLGEE